MTGNILSISELRLQRGKRQVLSDVTLSASRGEALVLMGASGSGKTTVLRAIAGLERFDSGSITVDGITLSGGRALPPKALHRKVGMVFQFHQLFDHLTALENICLAPVQAHGVSVKDARRRAQELLSAFGVQHRAQAKPRELSGGEAQRVAIARALAVDPSVLLMDEPTASLDPARRLELSVLIRGLVDQGRTLIVTTHDEAFARALASRVITLREGVVSH